MEYNEGLLNRDIGVADNESVENADAPFRVIDYPKKYAIVVGVTNYTNGIPPLKNAVNDACLIYDILKEEYNFSATLLACTDAATTVEFEPPFSVNKNFALESKGSGSREDILDAIDDVAKVATPGDLFLFFYSGHGIKDYMVPYGSFWGRNDSYQLYAGLYDALSRVKCNHQLFLNDCCFSGSASLVNFPRVIHRNNLLARCCPQELRKDQGEIDLRHYCFVLSVTDDATLTPDAFMSFRNGQGKESTNSAFTFSLAQILHNLSPGGIIRPAALVQSIETGMNACSFTTGTGPRFMGAGPGMLALVRPGIHIDLPDFFIVASGREAEIPLNATGASNIVWSLAENSPEGVSINGSSLNVKVKADSPSNFTVSLIARGDNELVAGKEIQIHVIPETTGPLSIITRQIPPCIVGKGYRFQLESEGGTFPVKWKVENLPKGLVCSPEGEIQGMICFEKSDKFQKLSHVLEVEARDDAGATKNELIRLVVVNLDEYCEVPAGYFTMGYQPDAEQNNELTRLGIITAVNQLAAHYPAGEHFLPRFFIKKTPVTEKEWHDFVKAHPGIHVNQPERWAKKDFNVERDGTVPITAITHEDIEAYCKEKGTRLPTGPEWEKAARGKNGNLFPWGNTFNPDLCNCKDLGWHELTPVDQFPQGASPWGVLDMAGNAWEWVRHRIKDNNSWRQTLRGGSYDRELCELPCCNGSHPLSTGIRLKVNRETGHLDVSDNHWRSQHVGFRDVIELDNEQVYPQGLVRIDRCRFHSPDLNLPVILFTGVEVARYAVSNEEYLAFVMDRNVDKTPIHWRPLNQGRPFDFSERFLPVVNISHNDAEAFCAWKTRKLERQCQLLTKEVWLAAAHGPAYLLPNNKYEGERIPHRYPWGNLYAPIKCNSCKTGMGGPAPVFDFSDGRSPCGCYNLVGNVAEWGDAVGDMAPGCWWVLGGSWEDDCSNMESWSKPCNAPNYNIGFRYYCK